MSTLDLNYVLNISLIEKGIKNLAPTSFVSVKINIRGCEKIYLKLSEPTDLILK